MKRIVFSFIGICLLCSLFFVPVSCDTQDDGLELDSMVVLRKKVLDDYKNIYLQSAVTNVGWTGNATNCDAGTIPDEVQNKVLSRINYFRKLVGLAGDITFDAAKNAKCQQGALMTTANGQLNHYPPSTWKCYTTEGKDACGNSNLYLGVTGSNAITGYIEDPGTSNNACGHRRWIIYSKAKIMGHGSTSNSDVLWVLGGSQTPAQLPEFIAYPPKNYVPAPLVFSKWSFAIPAADFTNATVSMRDSTGNNINLSVVSKSDNGYGDNTIVWTPTGIITNSAADIKYDVKIKDVKVGGVLKEYTYKVIIFKP